MGWPQAAHFGLTQVKNWPFFFIHTDSVREIRDRSFE